MPWSLLFDIGYRFCHNFVFIKFFKTKKSVLSIMFTAAHTFHLEFEKDRKSRSVLYDFCVSQDAPKEIPPPTQKNR